MLFSKVSDIITTVSAFVFSFYYEGLDLKIPYRIMYMLCSLFCGFSSILFFIESNKKYIYTNENIGDNKEENLVKDEED